MATIFRFIVIAALCWVATAAADTQPDARFLVWPPPKSIQATGDPLPLHPDFVVQIDSNSALLADTIQRHRVALAAGQEPQLLGRIFKKQTFSQPTAQFRPREQHAVIRLAAAIWTHKFSTTKVLCSLST